MEYQDAAEGTPCPQCGSTERASSRVAMRGFAPVAATALLAAITGVRADLIEASLGAPGSEPPRVTLQLRRAERDRPSLVVERNVARSPIVYTGPVQISLDWEERPAVYGRSVLVQGRLTPADALLYDWALAEYARAGCPADRAVPFSLTAAATALGARAVGGVQREAVKGSLRRLRAMALQSTIRHADGHEESLTWGLIDGARTTTRGGGKGWLRLSVEVAGLVREGSVALLDAQAATALYEADETAYLLYRLLSTERLPKPGGLPWRYSIYAAAPGQVASDRNLPALADLLGSADSNRRRYAARMRRAADLVMAHVPELVLAVTPAKGPSMWNLEAARHPRRDRADEVQEIGRVRYANRAGEVQPIGRLAYATEHESGGYRGFDIPSTSTVVSTARESTPSGDVDLEGFSEPTPSGEDRADSSPSRETSTAGGPSPQLRPPPSPAARHRPLTPEEAARPDVAYLLDRLGWPGITERQWATLGEWARAHDAPGREGEWAATTFGQHSKERDAGDAWGYAKAAHAEWVKRQGRRAARQEAAPRPDPTPEEEAATLARLRALTDPPIRAYETHDEVTERRRRTAERLQAHDERRADWLRTAERLRAEGVVPEERLKPYLPDPDRG